MPSVLGVGEPHVAGEVRTLRSMLCTSTLILPPPPYCWLDPLCCIFPSFFFFVFSCLKQALLAKMFEDEPDGGSGVNLSLAELLRLKGEPQIVFATDSARGAGKAIARGRKAVRNGTGDR